MLFKILVVDDDYINRRLLISLLKKSLYQVEVIEAIDGEDALKKCKHNLNIQLILLDIEMPKMDGADFLKEYKKNKLLPNIPIISVSSNDLRKNELLQLGADSFLIKPVTQEKLLLSIQSLFI